MILYNTRTHTCNAILVRTLTENDNYMPNLNPSLILEVLYVNFCCYYIANVSIQHTQHRNVVSSA